MRASSEIDTQIDEWRDREMESQQSRMWRGVFRRKEEENEQAN